MLSHIYYIIIFYNIYKNIFTNTDLLFLEEFKIFYKISFCKVLNSSVPAIPARSNKIVSVFVTTAPI